MSKSYWKTRFSWNQREAAPALTSSQIVRQFGIGLLILVLWGAAFAAYAQIIGEPEQAGSAAAVVVPTPTPAAVSEAPGATATLEPTATSAPTATMEAPTPTSLATTATTHSEEVTAEPTAIPSDTPSPQATATQTVLPPTDTPIPQPSGTPTTASAEEAQVSFSADVLPILENRCVKCHGGERTEEGLALNTYADVMAGSWNGPAVIPGDAEGSYLVELIISGDMPKRAPRLLPAEIRFITEWINAGAVDN